MRCARERNTTEKDIVIEEATCVLGSVLCDDRNARSAAPKVTTLVSCEASGGCYLLFLSRCFVFLSRHLHG